MVDDERAWRVVLLIWQVTCAFSSIQLQQFFAGPTRLVYHGDDKYKAGLCKNVKSNADFAQGEGKKYTLLEKRQAVQLAVNYIHKLAKLNHYKQIPFLSKKQVAK